MIYVLGLVCSDLLLNIDSILQSIVAKWKQSGVAKDAVSCSLLQWYVVTPRTIVDKANNYILSGVGEVLVSKSGVRIWCACTLTSLLFSSLHQQNCMDI